VITGDEFLTVADVAELLKVNQLTVRNWSTTSAPTLHLGRRSLASSTEGTA
jgi:hypothetical protein